MLAAADSGSGRQTGRQAVIGDGGSGRGNTFGLKEDGVIVDEICIPGRDVQSADVKQLRLALSADVSRDGRQQRVRFTQIGIQLNASLQEADCFLTRATLAVGRLQGRRATCQLSFSLILTHSLSRSLSVASREARGENTAIVSCSPVQIGQIEVRLCMEGIDSNYFPKVHFSFSGITQDGSQVVMRAFVARPEAAETQAGATAKIKQNPRKARRLTRQAGRRRKWR